jgi:hypothetical protein
VPSSIRQAKGRRSSGASRGKVLEGKEKKTKGVKNTTGETAKKNHQKTNRSNLGKKNQNQP